ncbi:MAG: hypothetical protein IPM83_16295 [Ignavibacteria bacterium]|nr:hypothetical protein [Ignavibacteria bacterium]
MTSEIYTTFDGGNTWSTSQVRYSSKEPSCSLRTEQWEGACLCQITNSTVVLSTNDGGQSWAFEAGFDEMPSSIHESRWE